MVDVFSFLKADTVLRRSVAAHILKELHDDPRVTIESLQIKTVPGELVDRHYAHVTGRPFYPWLRHYSTAIPVYVMILSGDDGVVEHLRTVLGATMAHKADADTIRGRFGIYAGVNCMHASDSAESAATELAMWNEALGLSKGTFDVDIAAFISENADKYPILTPDLRETVREMADNGVSDAAQAQVRLLLAQECPDATAEEMDALLAIVVGAVS